MKVFLSGVAGTGMSSLAGLFKDKGYDVYGSDTAFYPPTGSILKKMGIKLFKGFSEQNIPDDVDFCIVGNIVSRGNPEAEYILNNKIRFYSMAEALNNFFIRGKESVVVAGTHGKTTISSFIAYLFRMFNLNPGYFIGGKPVDFDSNYSVGEGKYFISEGDEYETAFFDRSSKFLKYFPDIIILTSLEYDHLDFFKTEREYIDAFKNLVNQVPLNGMIISNNDYPMNRKVTEKSFPPVVTYGTSEGDFLISRIKKMPVGYGFTVTSDGKQMTFQTKLIGKYNIHNLVAGIITGIKIGIPMDVIKKGVESFNGVERRLRLIGEKDNTVFFEDFAHHPTSVKGVLESLKEMFPNKKLIALFEPGSWSLKNKMFEGKLSESLSVADEVRIKRPERMEKIPENERLSISNLTVFLEKSGVSTVVHENIGEFENFLKRIDTKGDNVVVVLSNGRFGFLPEKIGNMFN